MFLTVLKAWWLTINGEVQDDETWTIVRRRVITCAYDSCWLWASHMCLWRANHMRLWRTWLHWSDRWVSLRLRPERKTIKNWQIFPSKRAGTLPAEAPMAVLKNATYGGHSPSGGTPVLPSARAFILSCATPSAQSLWKPGRRTVWYVKISLPVSWHSKEIQRVFERLRGGASRFRQNQWGSMAWNHWFWQPSRVQSKHKGTRSFVPKIWKSVTFCDISNCHNVTFELCDISRFLSHGMYFFSFFSKT